jgi:hypothetical protein
LAEEHQATLLLPHQTFCAGERCLITRDRTPLYYDTDHLTRTGALELRPLLEPHIREIAQ